MFDFAPIYKRNEQPADDSTSVKLNGVVLSFPYPLPQSTIDCAPMTVDADIIDCRMKAPLVSHEMIAVLRMVKQRAQRLGQQLWVTMGAFLATMGAEELGDLRRHDFVRAVKYLVAAETGPEASSQTQSRM